MTNRQSLHLDIIKNHLDAITRILEQYKNSDTKYTLVVMEDLENAVRRCITNDDTADKLLLMKE